MATAKKAGEKKTTTKKTAAKKTTEKKPKIKNYINKDDIAVFGEKYGVCRECGKTFEQEVRPGGTKYTNWDLCPECRMKRAYEAKKQQEMKENELYGSSYNAVIDYTPFPSQQRLHNAFERCRFLVISRGNRWGKDRFTNMAGIKYFVEILNENRYIDAPDMSPPAYWWIIAPTERMTRQNWRELKQYFPKQWVVAISESTMTMETIGGGIIETRSAYDPESLVGVGLDLVTITEAARIPDLETVWANLEARLSSPGRGRKVDRGLHKYGYGKAIINSSPIGLNYFHTMWLWGQKGSSTYVDDWYSEQLPWTDNPINATLAKSIRHTSYGDITYEESLRRRLGDRVYRQNFLADFVSENNSVFPNFEENCVTNIYSNDLNLSKRKQKEFVDEWESPKPYEVYRVAWDIATGSSSDTPAVVVRNMGDNRIVKIISLYGMGYNEQYNAIAEICRMYNNAECVYSLTGHTAVKGQLEIRGVYEIPVTEQGGNKAQYVHRLVSAVENKDLKVLYDGTATAQTLIYEMNDYTQKAENVFSNRAKHGHDDFVSALYLAFYDYEAVPEIVPFMGLFDAV